MFYRMGSRLDFLITARWARNGDNSWENFKATDIKSITIGLVPSQLDWRVRGIGPSVGSCTPAWYHRGALLKWWGHSAWHLMRSVPANVSSCVCYHAPAKPPALLARYCLACWQLKAFKKNGSHTLCWHQPNIDSPVPIWNFLKRHCDQIYMFIFSAQLPCQVDKSALVTGFGVVFVFFLFFLNNYLLFSKTCPDCVCATCITLL